MLDSYKKILKMLFYIESFYVGAKKYKIYYIFGFKIKVRVKIRKNLRKFIKWCKPRPLKNIQDTTKREKAYLSIAAIFKDEPDIIEWIHYHILAGVDRFYLYDNESDPKYYEILKPYIDSGVVVYKRVHGKCMQIPAYCDAVYRYKNETEWLAIIDLDEYLLPVETNSLKDFLKDYENYPGVVVNWVMFDSNGLNDRESNKTVIESFTRVYENYNTPINKTVKSIVKPSKVRYVNSVHVCIYKNNELAVNENFEPHTGVLYFQTQKNSTNKIRINHYHCKSKNEYLKKVSKGFADQSKQRWFEEEKLNFKNTTHDFVIWKYLDKIKNNKEYNLESTPL